MPYRLAMHEFAAWMCLQGGYLLPATLRVLALYNKEEYYDGQLECLVQKCRGLQELYLSNFHTQSVKPPKFARLWPALQKLRVLVLDVVNNSCDSTGWVSAASSKTVIW